MESSKDLKQVIAGGLGAGVEYAGEACGVQMFYVNPNRICDVCQFLRDTNGLEFDYLASLCAVDFDDRMEVVYHLYSLALKHMVILKVKVNRKSPSLPSVCSVWKAANWQEREAYDLFGINFDGHPDLRRILLEPEWEGFPLRKDYKL